MTESPGAASSQSSPSRSPDLVNANSSLPMINALGLQSDPSHPTMHTFSSRPSPYPRPNLAPAPQYAPTTAAAAHYQSASYAEVNQYQAPAYHTSQPYVYPPQYSNAQPQQNIQAGSYPPPQQPQQNAQAYHNGSSQSRSSSLSYPAPPSNGAERPRQMGNVPSPQSPSYSSLSENTSSGPATPLFTGYREGQSPVTSNAVVLEPGLDPSHHHLSGVSNQSYMSAPPQSSRSPPPILPPIHHSYRTATYPPPSGGNGSYSSHMNVPGSAGGENKWRPFQVQVSDARERPHA